METRRRKAIRTCRMVASCKDEIRHPSMKLEGCFLHNRTNMASRQKTLKNLSHQLKVNINKVNREIDKYSKNAEKLNNSLDILQNKIDCIRNKPAEQIIRFEELKRLRLGWQETAEKRVREENTKALKVAGTGIVAAGVGKTMAVAAIGPIGLSLAFSIGVISTLIGGFLFIKDRKGQLRLEDIFITITESNIYRYNLALVEINERISRINNELVIIYSAIERIDTFGTDYRVMSESQRYELGSYHNYMEGVTHLLIEPILGLQPLFSERDFYNYKRWKYRTASNDICTKYKDFIISVVSFLGPVELQESDKKLLLKTFKKNKDLLNSFQMKSNELDDDLINAIYEAHNYAKKFVIQK